MWHSFVLWFSHVIQFFYGLTVTIGLHNYGLAIILLTIVIKLVLFPITQKQLKSMRAMQEIQPKMKYIQEKYKDDPQTMQMKLMGLYKEHGVSPLSGCLPLIIQMPIFIAFYQALIKFKFTVQADASFLWIPNIGSKDPWFILALLAGLTTYLQQRVSMVDTKDATQRTMLYFMPVFMIWVASTVPAGLPLYWVVFNILGIAQQLYVNKMHEKEKLDSGIGVTIDTGVHEEREEIKEEVPKKEEPPKKVEQPKKDKASEPGKGARRDKGGKNNGASNNRKKRKNS